MACPTLPFFQRVSTLRLLVSKLKTYQQIDEKSPTGWRKVTTFEVGDLQLVTFLSRYLFGLRSLHFSFPKKVQVLLELVLDRLPAALFRGDKSGAGPMISGSMPQI